MSDRESQTVSTRVAPEMAEKLQTVTDAESMSKAEYLREALIAQLDDDHDNLSEQEELKAEINELERKVEDRSGDGNGLPDPLGLFG